MPRLCGCFGNVRRSRYWNSVPVRAGKFFQDHGLAVTRVFDLVSFKRIVVDARPEAPHFQSLTLRRHDP